MQLWLSEYIKKDAFIIKSNFYNSIINTKKIILKHQSKDPSLSVAFHPLARLGTGTELCVKETACPKVCFCIPA